MNEVGKYLKCAVEKMMVFCMKLFETVGDIFKWIFFGIFLNYF